MRLRSAVGRNRRLLVLVALGTMGVLVLLGAQRRALSFSPLVERCEALWTAPAPVAACFARNGTRVGPEVVPPGVLPPGFVASYAEQSARGWLVVARVRRERESGLEDVTTTAWIFTPAWQLLGQVADLPFSPIGDTQVTSVWNPTGGDVVLAVTQPWVRGRGWVSVGVAKLPGLRYEELLRVAPAGDYHWARLLRTEEKVYFARREKGMTTIWAVDLDSRESTVVLNDDQHRNPVEDMFLSPDTNLLAFDRFHSDWRHHGDGIWLVNLATGSSGQLTFENRSDYVHEVVGFEDDDTLLFMVPQGGGRQRVYRLHLKARADPGIK